MMMCVCVCVCAYMEGIEFAYESDLINNNKYNIYICVCVYVGGGCTEDATLPHLRSNSGMCV